MNLFRRSLAEDAVDRYNHTWSVMLLLVLSLITWLLPLSLFLHLQPATPDQDSPATNVQSMPRYTAQCWCPAHFTREHVMYVQAICAAAFNRALNDVDNEEDAKTHEATLYNVLDSPIPVDLSEHHMNMRFNPSPVNTTSQKDLRKENSNNENTSVSQDVTYFISFTTPLILFIFAVCLKLPHVIWTVLSGFAGINIDQTLETAKTGQQLNKDSRYQLKEDLGHAISKSVKSTSSSTSLLYLFFKLLMCVVVFAALVVVKTDLLPKVQNLEDEIAAHRDLKSTGNMRSIQPALSTNIMPQQCEFRIRQRSNVHEYLVQCMFTPDESSASSNMYLKDLMATASKERVRIHLVMYESLYTILFAFFVVLAIINVASLLIWCAKLVLGPCHQRVSSSTNLPVDFYLLLFMAQENVGHLVADYLAESFSRGSGGQKEVIEGLEDKNM